MGGKWIWRCLRGIALMLAIGLLVVACGTTSTTSAPEAKGTPSVSTPTTTPRPHPPAATPGTTPPTPTNVPAGWQVYTGVYFSIAYPSGWLVIPIHQDTERQSPGTVDISYFFHAPDGHTFTFEERNYLAAATIQANCSSPGQSVQIVAGLPMLYSTSNVGIFRSYYFATDQNVDFIISATIATDDTTTPALFASVYNTLRPIYTTPACR